MSTHEKKKSVQEEKRQKSLGTATLFQVEVDTKRRKLNNQK